MSAFTIKDLENLSGIKAHTIRMWEQRYNLLKPQRSCTNIRYYSNEELKTLLNIALLNKCGYKISHIDKMCQEEICQKVLSLRDSEAMQEIIVNELVQDMVDLQTDKFETTLSKYICNFGIENGVLQIIFPFLEKIGILWQTGHIMPAQEHFVTNIIRQKLIVGIDGLPCNPEGKTCLLFLPEKEYHEMGLLFLCYLLKKQGMRVIYLGANVPMGDVASIADTMQPDLAFVHLISSFQHANLEKLVNNIETRLPGVKTIISGYPTKEYDREIPEGVELKRCFHEMMDFISRL
ncbi:MerR family transcriptional regulator [Terrimonas sp. NA20]|uniref:MerR family transcriptional regulator n=1 Tax=Terrimonas ginsenosidimutans TaxID=2908004 RepID=A0ABS9KNV1_9BACT|nr:MerR family transcriptional regulator [Terrimonas ginsenosidimutans]MCG2613993.1 MerR family transcriptional regulator [Terrimonas ginsenosidimutans]